MIQANINEVLDRFEVPFGNASSRPYGSGHINDTFLIESPMTSDKKYILQRINHRVFRNVPGLMENLRIVCDHILKQIEVVEEGMFLPDCYTFFNTQDGRNYYRDADGNFWRLSLFVDNSLSYDIIDTEERAYNGGLAYGQFQRLLANLDAKRLIDTIPRFHDINFRLDNFHNALAADPLGRSREVETEIAVVTSHADEMSIILKAGRAGDIPLRITHNDTKFNNILFDEQDHVLGVIDLDTVMPGYIHYDFGDAIRTGASTAPEDTPDLSGMEMNITLFRAFTNGFLSRTRDILTPRERDYLALSARLLTFIMGLRFLTDYIEGDVYYKIHIPDHNLRRARAQFKLLESMDRQYDAMCRIIRNLSSV